MSVMDPGSREFTAFGCVRLRKTLREDFKQYLEVMVLHIAPYRDIPDRRLG
jgi:hypothetical protein